MSEGKQVTYGGFFGLVRKRFSDGELDRLAESVAAELAVTMAQARIDAVEDTSEQRWAEMEAADPNPDDGAIEVGKLKEVE